MAASILVLLALASHAQGMPLPPYNLKCEGNRVGLRAERLQQLHKHHLFGTDNPNPILSWTVAHTERAARQTAFQVIVAEDKFLDNIFWDSGKMLNKDRTSIRYAGPPLHTAKTYFWRVMWWDHKGEVAVSEETGHFLVGVLDPKDWDTAKWIAAGNEIKTALYLHKTFTIKSSEIKNATLFVAGLRYNKPFVNGTDLNAQYDSPVALTPSWTNYKKFISYTAYDVTLLASKCDNLAVEVMLGVSWRNTANYPSRDPGGLRSTDSTERVLKVLLVITNNDNSNTTLNTDESWSVDETNITSDSIYNGEMYGPMLERDLAVSASMKPKWSNVLCRDVLHG